VLIPVQVVIGRGRGGAGFPLSAAYWGRFQSKIIHFMAVRGEFYRAVEGLGIDENGAPEENLTLLGSVTNEDLGAFRIFLDNLRIEFEQVVILLIVGELDVIA
jgi:hypothetical protein